MDCCLRHGYRRYLPMNLPESTGQVGTVWTDGFGRHNSDPQHRRCGVGYYTDSQERVWLPLAGLRQSVYGADFLAMVRSQRVVAC
eukprot:836456-Amphidinium_carterae.1